jgi:hypothetical protein
MYKPNAGLAPMPSRYSVFAILLFWAVTTGWFFERDLWPRLRPGEPPPFSINLADEAQRNAPAIYWTVFCGEQEIGKAKTWIKYHEPDDTFELHSQIFQLRLGGLITVKSVAGMYRITRDGELRAISADLSLAIRIPNGETSIRAYVDGPVQEHRFTPRCQIESPLGNKEVELDSVEICAHGSVLNPLHPVNRVMGLRRGQRWRMPLVDPLTDAASAVLGKSSNVRILDAEVLRETKWLFWDGEDRPCLVIDYRGDAMSAQTWVRANDGTVLRQVATVQGEQLIMERDWTRGNRKSNRAWHLE